MRIVRLTAVIVLFCAPAFAGGLQDEDRELNVAVGAVDLDRGAAGPIDLGSSDGPELSVSIDWMRSRVFGVGLRAAYVDLEEDLGGVSRGGLIYGVFIAVHVPTEGRVTPYFTAGASFLAGDLADPYDYGLDFSAGLKVYPAERLGFSVELLYTSLEGADLVLNADNPVLGEDFAPDGNALRLRAGLLYKF